MEKVLSSLVAQSTYFVWDQLFLFESPLPMNLPALKRVVFMKGSATDHCELISGRNKKSYWIETNYWRRNVMNARFIWWINI